MPEYSTLWSQMAKSFQTWSITFEFVATLQYCCIVAVCNYLKVINAGQVSGVSALRLILIILWLNYRCVESIRTILRPRRQRHTDGKIEWCISESNLALVFHFMGIQLVQFFGRLNLIVKLKAMFKLTISSNVIINIASRLLKRLISIRSCQDLAETSWVLFRLYQSTPATNQKLISSFFLVLSILNFVM